MKKSQSILVKPERAAVVSTDAEEQEQETLYVLGNTSLMR